MHDLIERLIDRQWAGDPPEVERDRRQDGSTAARFPHPGVEPLHPSVQRSAPRRGERPHPRFAARDPGSLDALGDSLREPGEPFVHRRVVVGREGERVVLIGGEGLLMPGLAPECDPRPRLRRSAEVRDGQPEETFGQRVDANPDDVADVDGIDTRRNEFGHRAGQLLHRAHRRVDVGSPLYLAADSEVRVGQDSNQVVMLVDQRQVMNAVFEHAPQRLRGRGVLPDSDHGVGHHVANPRVAVSTRGHDPRPQVTVGQDPVAILCRHNQT